LLLLGLLLFWKSPTELYEAKWTSGPVLASAFGLANLVALACHLVPTYVATSSPQVPTDGMSLYMLLFTVYADKSAVFRFCGDYFYGEGGCCLLEKQLDKALEWFDRGLEFFPGSFGMPFGKAIALFERGDFAQSRQIWLQLLEHPDTHQTRRNMLYCLIARTDLMLEPESPLDEAKYLEEAGRFSAEAFSNLPWMRDVKTVRAAVLIESGELDEGEPILRGVLRDLGKNGLDLTCFCYLGLAAAKLGNARDSQGWLDKARQLDPDSKILETVARKAAKL